MSQDRILAALSSEPRTQKELSDSLHIEPGVLSHRLNALRKKGLVERKQLEIRYRPWGYTRVVDDGMAKDEMLRWPTY